MSRSSSLKKIDDTQWVDDTAKKLWIIFSEILSLMRKDVDSLNQT